MTGDTAQGERIAKVMARAGVASRRDAERLIVAGRVAVNGAAITSPALDIMPGDKVTLDGKPIDEPQPPRLWLYYKPLGLVTSEKDEKGRQTVFESLPEGMPRVMSVGRLDLNSEGLLLLTNDGELKRRLELPETGWLRRYRVRVNGRPNDATFDPLRRGMTIDGEAFVPMDVSLDRQQGANAWATVGLREGKNRELRRAMAEVGLTVNRLIRVSYGPFRLNEMEPGTVVEVKARVMREQLGGLLDGLIATRTTRDGDAPRPARPGDDRKAERPRKPREGGGERPARSVNGPRTGKPATDRPRRDDDPAAARPPRAGAKPRADRPPRADGDRPARPYKAAGSERPRGKPSASSDGPPRAVRTWASKAPRRDGEGAGAGPKAGAKRWPAKSPRPGSDAPAGAKEARRSSAEPKGEHRGAPAGERPKSFASKPRRHEGEPPRRAGGPSPAASTRDGAPAKGPAKARFPRSATSAGAAKGDRRPKGPPKGSATDPAGGKRAPRSGPGGPRSPAKGPKR